MKQLIKLFFVFTILSIFAGCDKNDNQDNEIILGTWAQQPSNEWIEMLGTINFAEIGILFVVYFIGGYLLYSSLFAAIGSAVDSQEDTQQFMLPVTLL